MQTGIEIVQAHLDTLPEDHRERADVQAWIADGHKRNIRPFAESARRDYERAGFKVLRFRESLASLRDAGNPFWYITPAGDEFLTTLSRPTEVLFHPDPAQFYLPESNNLDLDAQLALTAQHDADMKKKLGGGVDFILGEAPTHAGVAFRYFKERGVRSSSWQ